MKAVNALIQEIINNPPTDGFWFEPLNTFVDGTGGLTRGMHRPQQCDGRPCPIHAPSDHSLRHLKLHYRYSDIGIEPIIAERMCEHGVGHPDPDFIAFIVERHGQKAADAESVHGCDGCCGTGLTEQAAQIEAAARITAREDDTPFIDPPTPEARLKGWEAEGSEGVSQ